MLRKRRLSREAMRAPELAVSMVEELGAAIARSAYTRGSMSAHGFSSAQEIHQLKMYVDAVLAELLNRPARGTRTNSALQRTGTRAARLSAADRKSQTFATMKLIGCRFWNNIWPAFVLRGLRRSWHERFAPPASRSSTPGSTRRPGRSWPRQRLIMEDSDRCLERIAAISDGFPIGTGRPI